MSSAYQSGVEGVVADAGAAVLGDVPDREVLERAFLGELARGHALEPRIVLLGDVAAAVQVELALDELEPLSADELVARRYDKFRAMGGDRTCSL